ncbi:MAG: hypothetical protein ACJ74R_13635, partial [Gaiellaceae bacterium]
TIDDVRRASPSVPLAVIALRPRSRSKIYAHAVDLFTELGADVVEEPEIASWAHDAAQDIYPVLVKR